MDFITVDGEQVPVPDGTPDAQLPAIAARHRASKQNPFVRGLIGAGSAVAEPLLGIGQLATRGAEALGVPGAAERRQEIEADVVKLRGGRAGAGTAGTVGEVATFAVGGLATALPKTIARAAGRAAVEQGLYEGSRATVGDDPSRAARAATGAAWGAGGGAAGHALPAALSRVAQPVQASAPVQAVVQQFRSAGMKPALTLGQAVNGPVGRMEEALASIPGTGIRNAREDALNEWNRAQLVNASREARAAAEARLGELNAGQTNPALMARPNDLAPALGPRDIPKAGHRGVEAVQQQKNALYDAGLRNNVVAASADDAPFAQTDAVLQRLVPEDAAKISKLRDNLFADLQSGNVRGDKIKEIDSELRQVAEKAYRDGQYELGRAFDALHGDYRGVMQGFMFPADLAKLTQADELYARLVPMQNAAAMQGSLARGGVFTPSQQLSQIRASNPKSTLARGGARGQQGAEAAQQVYGGSIPEVGPGTAEKLLGSGLAIGGGATLADLAMTGELDPRSAAGYLAPLAGAALLRRPGVARAAIGETNWQQALQRSPQWLATQARIEALRGPTRAAAARLAQEQEDEKRRRGY